MVEIRLLKKQIDKKIKIFRKLKKESLSSTNKMIRLFQREFESDLLILVHGNILFDFILKKNDNSSIIDKLSSENSIIEDIRLYY